MLGADSRAPSSALRHSKDPALFAIVLEDLAALAGLVVALIGILLADKFGIAEADGVASIVIGLILGAVAVFMSREIRSLIVGEAATPAMRTGIRQLIHAELGTGRPIRAINEIRTMHLGPEDVLVAASVDFHDTGTVTDVEATTARLEQAIRTRYPAVRNLFLEVQGEEEHTRLSRLGQRGHSATQEHHGPEPSRLEPKPAKIAAASKFGAQPGSKSTASAMVLAPATKAPPAAQASSRKLRKKSKKHKGR